MGVFFTSPYRLLDHNNNLISQAPSIELTGTHNPGESSISSQPLIGVVSSWYCSLTRLQEIRTAYGGSYVDLAILKNGCKIRLNVAGLDSSSISVGIDLRDANNNNIGSTGFSQLILSGNDKFEGVDILFFGDSYYRAQLAICRHAYTNYVRLADFSQTQWNTMFANAKAPDDPYGLDENETPPGGYGGFNYSGDDDLPPSLPTLSAAQVGFVSLWNPSQQEMKDLADYLWTGTFDLTNFKKLFTDPMECILSVGIVPVTPTTGTATEIVFGGSSHSGVNAKPITSQFVTVDLGKVHINGQSASALDYSPYVKVSIFLPYCGTYALDADDVMDADVELEYHIDIYTGACVAYLTITRTNSDGSTLHSTLYQFTGNCLASIPITGNDHSQFIQSMLFMGAAVAATVATSGAGAPAIEGAAASGDVAGASAVNAVTASSAVNSVMSMKPNVLRSGNLSSTAGLLGKQRPCITVTWPNLCRPDTEYKLLGMPVHKSGALSDFEGFTIVSAVHVENILCTEIEKQMIEQMLYRGVMV